MTYLDKALELYELYFDADQVEYKAIEQNAFTAQIGVQRENARKDYKDFMQYMFQNKINMTLEMP